MSTENKPAGIILFAHGSRVEEANLSVRNLAQEVERAGPYRFVRAAFLELAQPDLSTAIREAVDSGIRRLIVIPYFLTMGIHLRRDLPNLMKPEKQKYRDVEIEVAQPLEGHPLMASIILGRVREVTGETKAAP